MALAVNGTSIQWCRVRRRMALIQMKPHAANAPMSTSCIESSQGRKPCSPALRSHAATTRKARPTAMSSGLSSGTNGSG